MHSLRRGFTVAAASAAVGLAGGAAHATGSVSVETRAACTPGLTKTVVRAFVRDYALGRIAAVDRLWAPAPRFQWFSTGAPGARLGGRAYHRATLVRYFRARARRHERLRLIRVSAGYDDSRGIVHFAGRLVRSADDIARRPVLDFKGAADCVSERPMLIVWSM